MKKIINTIVALGIILSSSGAYAQQPLLTSAPAQAAYRIVIDGTDLPAGGVYTEGKNIMLPLRSVAEKLGFKVEWDGETQSVSLDNGEVNTKIRIGEDRYYMASSKAIGMSAPTVLGAAPVNKNGTTFVPAEMFNILNCGEAFTVENNVITFKNEDNGTQIPNPLKDYESIAEAEKAVGFKTLTSSALPNGYKLSYIGTISDEVFQLFYSNDKNEIVYRMAKGSDDISGDYNVYKTTKTLKINNLDVTFRENGETTSAFWKNGEYTFSLSSNTVLGEKAFTDFIKGLK